METQKKDLLKLIQENYSSLSKGQKLIAEYIMNSYDKAAFMTASKLGEKVGVSESTVVRFANALGFSGYPRLQTALHELIKIKLTTVQRLSMSDDFPNKGTALKNVMKSDIENIRSTIDDTDLDMFNKVIDSIFAAKRIYIIGLRSSASLAGYLGFYLGLILDNVKVVSFGMSDVFEQLLRVSEDDLVIGIGFPRYSRKTLEALRYVKKENCTIVGVTDSKASPIANLADYALLAKSNMATFVDSLVAPMSLINALIVAIGMRDKNELTEYLNKLENIWEEYNIYDGKEKTNILDDE